MATRRLKRFLLLLFGITLSSTLKAATLIPSDFNYRMKICFTHFVCEEDLHDIPLLVKVNPATMDFYANIAHPADGGDVRFTDADQTTILPHEIDVWNTSGESLFWVKTPQLGTNTCIWVYWDNAAATLPGYTSDGSVWSNGYLGVWHMNESGNTPFDSAQIPRDNSGIDAGTDANVVPNGIVGRAYNYINRGRVRINNDGDLAGLNNATINFWYLKLGQGGANLGTILGSGSENIGIRHLESDALFLRIQGGDVVWTPPLANSFFDWNHITFSYDGPGKTVDAYLNGARTLRNLTAFPWYAPDNLVGILGTDERAPNGVLDEMRISAVTRSSNWLHAVWMNMASNDVFNTVSTSEVPQVDAPVIRTLTPTGVTETNALLRGQLVWTGTLATAAFAYYGTNDGGTVASNWDFCLPFFAISAPTPILYSSNAVGLLPGTRYYVTHRATNSFGEHWSGRSRSFVTPGNPTVGNGVGVTDQLDGNARLNGEFLTPVRGDAYFFWGTSDGGTNQAAWDHVISLGPVETRAFSAAILDLLYGAEYYYRTYATNAFGDDWADATMFLPSIPPGLGIENRDASSITINGATANGTLFGAGALLDVHFYYGLNDGGTNIGSWSNTVFLGAFTNRNVPDLSVDLTGLMRNTNYYYTFRAVNNRAEFWAEPSTTFIVDLDPLSYTHRVKMTLCGYGRPAPLTNIPMLIKLGPAVTGFDYADFTSPTGGDLRFMNRDFTRFLNYEVDTWNPGGESHVWVQIPQLVGSNTCIWAMWGNPTQTTPPDYATDGSTWSEGYIGVWHLSETTDPHFDSSVNKHHTEFSSGDIDRNVLGQVGGADAFLDANNNWFELGDRPSLDQGYDALTIEAWVFDASNDPTPHKGIVSKRVTWGSGESYYLLFWNQRRIYFNIGSDRDRGNTSLPANEWHHVAATFNGNLPANRKRFYFDGQPDGVAEDVHTAIPNQNSDLHLGILNDVYGDSWHGRLDELRISSAARSPDWMWAVYENMNTGTTFVCYDPVQPVADIDLALTKTASSTNLLAGSNLTYHITVQNVSGTDVNQAWVTDTLPVEVVFLASAPPPTNQAGQMLTYAIGPLSAGSSLTITVNVAVVSALSGFITNRAELGAASNETVLANNTGQAVTFLPDSDGDGIANPADPDDDNDRFPDESEVIANTDPYDPNSFLWVRIARTGDRLVRTLTFPASASRTYQIESSPDLNSNNWSVLQNNIPGTNGLLSIDDTNANQRVYYRIGVRSP